MAKASDDGKVLNLDKYRGMRRTGKPAPAVEMPVMDEAMRNLHAAAHAALKLIFLARHRLGLPQL